MIFDLLKVQFVLLMLFISVNKTNSFNLLSYFLEEY